MTQLRHIPPAPPNLPRLRPLQLSTINFKISIAIDAIDAFPFPILNLAISLISFALFSLSSNSPNIPQSFATLIPTKVTSPLPVHIHLQIAGNTWLATRLRAEPVRFDPNKIDGNRETDSPHQIGEEDEGAGGDADEDQAGMVLKVGGDLGGEFQHASGDLGRDEENTGDVGVH